MATRRRAAREAKQRRRKKRRTAGRPRGGSDEVIRAVLQATLDTLRVKGFGALSIEAVATSAGVAKTSIYRRWPTKEKLVLAAWVHLRTAGAPEATSDDLRADLIGFASTRAARMKLPIARALAQAVGALDDKETVTLANDLYDTGAAPIIARIERAKSDRVISASADSAAAAELLIALVAFRAMTRRTPLPSKDIARAVDVVLRGLGGSKRSRR